MKKILEVPIGRGNEEPEIAKKLKNFRHRFEYACAEDGSRLKLVFSSQEMPIKTVVKQFKAERKAKGVENFLREKTFDKNGEYSVWRVAGEVKLKKPSKKFDKSFYLIFFEKTVSN